MNGDIAYLVIEPHGDIKQVWGPLDDGGAQAILGGPVSPLPRPTNIDLVVLGVEGIAGLDPNWPATSIIRNRLRPDSFVTGPVIVVGPPDESGAYTSLSVKAEEAVRRLVQK